MEQYTRGLFEPMVGEVFEFDRPSAQTGGDRVRLQLLEVSGPSTAPAGAGFREPFTLLFALRDTAELGPGLHRLAHQDFEPCDWFLNRVHVPGGDARQAYYQAVFG